MTTKFPGTDPAPLPSEPDAASAVFSENVAAPVDPEEAPAPRVLGLRRRPTRPDGDERNVGG